MILPTNNGYANRALSASAGGGSTTLVGDECYVVSERGTYITSESEETLLREKLEVARTQKPKVVVNQTPAIAQKAIPRMQLKSGAVF